jgi:hypothetical protein
MSGLRRQALSSGLTPLLKLAPPLLWLPDAVLVAALAGTGFPHRVSVSHDPAAMFAPLVWLLLGAVLLVLPGVWWWAMRLRFVATDGTSLFVIGPHGEAEVPLSEIAEITEWRSMDMRTVTVRFAHDTPAGRKIRFLAQTREMAPRGAPHPVVEMLQELVANVRQRPMRVGPTAPARIGLSRAA